MKVTAEHLAMIREAIDATDLDTPEVRERYRRRDIPRGNRVQDIDKRFRWDLLSAANSITRSEDGERLPTLIDTLYDAGCNDTHIDTALRAIVARIG